jgi:N-acetylglucosamine-6-phosphate deacetylase
VRTAIRAHARHGTTSIFPTTTTGSRKQISAMLESCKVARDEWKCSDGSRILGVHFYGPYFAEGMTGAHPAEGRRNPDKKEYTRALDSGIVKIATCAAELPGCLDFYRAARRAGCLVTCGHSNASWTEMAAAFKEGMRHVDHFWCAMSQIPSLIQRLGTPMQASMAEFVLANPEMSTEVIADGMHLAPELLEFAYRMIGPKRLCLVTDSNRALDMPNGLYRIGPKNTGEPFYSNGKAGYMPKTNDLASSCRGMDFMVRHMKSATSASLPEVIRMASLTPAERAGVSKELGSIERGKRADLLVLDRKLNVKRVFIGGEEFKERRSTTKRS